MRNDQSVTLLTNDILLIIKGMKGPPGQPGRPGATGTAVSNPRNPASITAVEF